MSQAEGPVAGPSTPGDARHHRAAKRGGASSFLRQRGGLLPGPEGVRIGITMKLILSLCLLPLLIGVGCAALPSSETVIDARDKKDTICVFIEAWAPQNPELEKPLQLCQADAELKEIAAAYAGCTAPLKTE